VRSDLEGLAEGVEKEGGRQSNRNGLWRQQYTKKVEQQLKNHGMLHARQGKSILKMSVFEDRRRGRLVRYNKSHSKCNKLGGMVRLNVDFIHIQT